MQDKRPYHITSINKEISAKMNPIRANQLKTPKWKGGKHQKEVKHN